MSYFTKKSKWTNDIHLKLFWRTSTIDSEKSINQHDIHIIIFTACIIISPPQWHALHRSMKQQNKTNNKIRNDWFSCNTTTITTTATKLETTMMTNNNKSILKTCLVVAFAVVSMLALLHGSSVQGFTTTSTNINVSNNRIATTSTSSTQLFFFGAAKDDGSPGDYVCKDVREHN